MAIKAGWSALFCVADVPLERINDILIKACEGAGYSALPKPWYFWLAAENFEQVPQPAKRPDGSDIMATKAPVKNFTSPYIGKDLKAVAKILQDAPDKVYLDREFFAVLDERTAKNGSVLLCYAKSDATVDSLRVWPKHSSLYLRAIDDFKWRELKENWELHKNRDGTDVLD